MTDKMETKDILSTLRNLKGISKAELARRIGVSTSTYSNWEYGNRMPRQESVDKLSELFGVSPWFIISGIPDTPQDKYFFENKKIPTLTQTLSNYPSNREEYHNIKEKPDLVPKDVQRIFSMNSIKGNVTDILNNKVADQSLLSVSEMLIALANNLLSANTDEEFKRIGTLLSNLGKNISKIKVIDK